MEKPTFKLVGAACGQHGQYTFYKALRYTAPKIGTERILALGDFFFVKLWQDSQLLSIGELQLLWTDRVSDQTLVSLRLYFLPENTPEGRGAHGQDEVLAINEKVVVRAGELLSWIWGGDEWHWGLPAVWRGACSSPPSTLELPEPLHASRLDLTDVDKEKATLEDVEAPAVVVFSYPRYCRYRALLRRLEGLQSAWLKDSLVAALGGYAGPTKRTKILFCKDTFEYPELEGHEFVCNHLAPRLKGRPRGRRRRRARSHSAGPPSDRDRDSDSSGDSDVRETKPEPQTPPRASLRNGTSGAGAGESTEERTADRAFMTQLRAFHRDRSTPLKHAHNLKHLRLRWLYQSVVRSGGYEQVCRDKGWRTLGSSQPQGRPASPSRAALTRRHYERVLLPFEKYERRNGSKWWKLPKLQNGTSKEPSSPVQDRKKHIDSVPITTIDITSESPVREIQNIDTTTEHSIPRLRTPSPDRTVETINLNSSGNDSSFLEEKPKDSYDPSNLLTKDERDKPASQLNQEFLDSLPKTEEEIPIKISVKPVEKLIERTTPPFVETPPPYVETPPSFNKILGTSGLTEYLHKQSLTDLSTSLLEMAAKQNSETPVSLLADIASKQNYTEVSNSLLAQIAAKQSMGDSSFYRDLSAKQSLGEINTNFLAEIAKAQQDLLNSTALTTLTGLSDKLANYANLAAGLANGQMPNGTMITMQQASDKLKSVSSGSSTSGVGSGGGTVSPPGVASRPAGRSLLRSVRVKPGRGNTAPPTPTATPGLRPDSASSSPPAPTSTPAYVGPTNFGINYLGGGGGERSDRVTSSTATDHHSDDEIIEVPYKPKTPEIIDLDEYDSPESPQAIKKKKLDILKERGLEVTAVSGDWPSTTAPATPVIPAPALAATMMHPNTMLGLNPAVQQQIMTQAQFFQMYNTIMPQGYTNGLTPPKVIQGKSIYGSPGPEKTVYGNPKDPFMPPPHVLQGVPPVKQPRSLQTTPSVPGPDILDLSSKQGVAPQKPAVEIVRIPSVPSPAKPISSTAPQNLSSKSYSLIDGKAVVGSNLEITLVGPKTLQTTPTKPRPRQKRSSTGQFMSNKTSPSSRESPNYSKAYTPTTTSTSSSRSQTDIYKERAKSTNIIIPSYQMSSSSRDSDVSPTSSTSSRGDGIAALTSSLLQVAGGALLQNQAKVQPNLAQILELQAKSNAQNLASFMDPSVYMNAVYSGLAGQLPGIPEQQLAMYQNLMSSRLMRNYPGLLNMSSVTSTPTTKN